MSKLVIISVSIFISVIISVFLISKKKQTIEKNEVNEVNDISKNIEPKLEPEPEVMIKVPESPPEVPTVSPNVIAPIVKDEEIVPEVLQKIPEDLVFVQEEIKSREPITVQRVVISRNSSGSNKVLTLAEIRLFNGSERISLDKAKVTQSSTFSKDTGAEKVIDGLNKFGIGGKSVSSTKTGNKHWLKLVPAKPVLATDIKIFTNIDASNQYTGVTMKVFGLNNLLILEKAISKNKVQTYSLVD